MEAGQRSSSVAVGQRLLSHVAVGQRSSYVEMGQRSSHGCLPDQRTGEELELEQKVHTPSEMDRAYTWQSQTKMDTVTMYLL